ncbi:hypothetical protein N0V90_006732 [Kalmusia sp. IMI 367209]|nr:hypothetical protein N0V90_006732 [Kalmusia sp. IMI 367209]
MVSFTYYPASGTPIFQREHWVSSIERTITGSDHSFELNMPELGSMRVSADGTTTYDLQTTEWKLNAMTTGRTGWGKQDTPEGWLVYLPLPLHWHVQSVASPAVFQLEIPSQNVPRIDQRGTATIHQEKNWANSFPSAHIWAQARSPSKDSGICLAGGKIIGMHAFIIGYRSPSLNVDFLPPFALMFAGIAPFMSQAINYGSRTVSLSVSNFWYKIDVRAQAPKEGGWFGLGSPFPEGHRKNFCTESFLAEINVVVYERKKWWSWAWMEVQREKFEMASLEFAGEYFPERGEKRE